MQIYIYIYIYIYVDMYVYICIYLFLHIYIYLYINIYIYTYIFIYLYTHTYWIQMHIITSVNSKYLSISWFLSPSSAIPQGLSRLRPAGPCHGDSSPDASGLGRKVQLAGGEWAREEVYDYFFWGDVIWWIWYIYIYVRTVDGRNPSPVGRWFIPL